MFATLFLARKVLAQKYGNINRGKTPAGLFVFFSSSFPLV